jgi:hypothetical protein
MLDILFHTGCTLPVRQFASYDPESLATSRTQRQVEEATLE